MRGLGSRFGVWLEKLRSGVTIPEAQRILGVKQYHTARKSMEKLVAVGILKQVGESSYGKSFIAEEILQTIGEGTKQ